MNIKELNLNDKEVSTTKISEDQQATIIAIRIKKDGTFPRHTTPVPALLTCIYGNVTFETENGEKTQLASGDYMHIVPNIAHWVIASEESHLLLIK